MSLRKRGLDIFDDYTENKYKNYLESEVNKKFTKRYKDKELLERCYKEIDILEEKELLQIIVLLYEYKKESKYYYHFKGMINNLFVLYVLGLTKVDPIKYSLPYELFNDKTVCIDVIDDLPLIFDFKKDAYK